MAGLLSQGIAGAVQALILLVDRRESWKIFCREYIEIIFP